MAVSIQARIAEDQAGSQARSARAEGGSASKRGQAGMQPGKVGSPGTAMADALRRAGFGARNGAR